MSNLKKIASHLFSLQEGTYTDKDGNQLFVELHKGRYRLSTRYAVYSFDDLYDNFFNTFSKLKLDTFSNGDVLLLGGGLGSIPYMLEKRFAFDASHTIVEYDENIIELFNNFTLPRLKSHIQVIQMDAVMAVEILEEKYDLLIIDVFVHDEIPEPVRTAAFLDHCAALLAPGGLLLFNWMTITRALKHSCAQYFEQIFQPCFPLASQNVTTYNTILISDKGYLKTVLP